MEVQPVTFLENTHKGCLKYKLNLEICNSIFNKCTYVNLLVAWSQEPECQYFRRYYILLFIIDSVFVSCLLPRTVVISQGSLLPVQILAQCTDSSRYSHVLEGKLCSYSIFFIRQYFYMYYVLCILQSAARLREMIKKRQPPESKR